MSDSLPAKWSEAELGDLVAVCRPRSDPQEFPDMPFVGMDNVEAHTMRLLGTVPAGTMRSNATHFLPGDILYGRLRPYLNKVLAPPFEGLASAEFIPLTPEPGVDRDFVRYRINAADFVSFTSRLDEGDRPRVDWNGIRQFLVSLPPSAEQRRIAEAIDSYLTRLDDAVASLERAQAKLQAYRASVLKTAVEGRLVRTEASIALDERRNYQPAEALLARILDERRHRWEEAEFAKLEAAGKTLKDDKWKAKYKTPAVADTNALPDLPEGWCWASVGQMAWSVKDGPHYSPTYAPQGVPFITGGQVRPWGVDFDAAKRISLEVHRKLSVRVQPEVGDLLYTKGGTTGIARVNTYEREFSVWVHVAVLKLAGSINPFYLQHALNSPICYGQAQRFTHGVGNQDLGLTRMVKIGLPLPPRAEQDRIVEEIDRLDSIARECAGLLDAQLLRAKRLRQAILKWAFQGKLVDQDGSDEAVAHLLTGIRDKRAAVVRAKANRGRVAKGAA